MSAKSTKHQWIATFLVLAACAAPAPEATYEVLTAEAEPLASAFNAARGKVRAVFLASPY